MKITHICLCGPVTDGFSYQDNLLPKYHGKAGHEVSLITSKWIWSHGGKIIKTNKEKYTNQDAVKMYRLELIGKDIFSKKIKTYKNFYKILECTKPDIIFVHGVQFLDIIKVKKYVKNNPSVKIFVDNHADYSNSASNWISKNILHKIVWKFCAKQIEQYTTKFYGVLPARVDFLNKIYGIPKEKIELLIMGGDDFFVEKYMNISEIINIKSELDILPTDFVIVTGGKIDSAKKQTLLLMEAMRSIKKKDVKLIVFGNVTSELKEQFDKYLSDDRIIYLGWLSVEESYKYFSIADLVIFPGRHSVYWEQVVALGVPMLIKYWEGTTHVDIGGNVDYLIEDSIEEIQDKIQELINNPKKYKTLKMNAQSIDKNNFLYSNIAEKSIRTRKKES
ncbi:glycosyltransferase family 4 protein [Aerococcus urinaeequi]|uniref:glycosyltransferase family 4 protein n=1 Tax=Aerococcus urinaeequi TaxID=51665 RepID=UPI003D6C3804